MITLSQQMKAETGGMTKRAETLAPNPRKRARKTVCPCVFPCDCPIHSSFRMLSSAQLGTETDKAPGPSRRKRKRAPTPPPINVTKGMPKKRRRVKPDNEYGVARGVDFLDVACVLNFDLPTSARAYTHRVGRTARAGRSGTALSFVLPLSEFGNHKAVGGVPSTRHDEEVWERITRAQQGRVREYVFDKRQVDAFRYRMEDALRAVTRYAVREARLKEIKQELLTSDKLKVRRRLYSLYRLDDSLS